MYKKIELLSKKDHQGLYYTVPSDFAYAKALRFAPLGITEIAEIACDLPVMISAEARQEFVVLMALSNSENYYSHAWKPNQGQPVPELIRHYPFVMVDAQQEGSDRNYRAIALDVESDAISTEGTFLIMGEDGQPSDPIKEKLTRLQNFEKQRNAMNVLVTALKKHELLDERSIDIKMGEETKTILSKFFVVNRERLYALPDEILAKWARNGWSMAIEAHMRSIKHVQKLLMETVEQSKQISH